MPSIDDIFGGSTLKSTDIKGRTPVVTIESVGIREFKEKDGNAKTKLEIFFVGAKKSLICNATNAKRIAHLYGPDYSMWGGKKIRLQVDMVDFGGNVMDGIRVYPPSDKIETGKRRPTIEEEMDDEVPF